MAETLEEMGAAIAALVPESLAGFSVARGKELVVALPRGAVLGVMRVLRDDPRFAFEQCMDITAVDWPSRPERFDIVYNLLSLSHNHRVRLVTTTDGTAPIDSVSGIWPSATWYERELWDMFGVVVAGQPDLRRILTDYGFEGHPLRKDFPLTGHVEVRYDATRRQVVYEPVKLVQDFRNFDFLSPWEAMTSLPGDEKVHLNRIEQEGGKP